LIFYLQDLDILFTRFLLLHTLTQPQAMQNGATKVEDYLEVVGAMLELSIAPELMKATPLQEQESTP
jgi:hypothetical protein